jgi:hypothetical protein
MTEQPVDYEKEREEDLKKIRSSTHPRKVVVAGPGTGKSYLFQKIIEDKKKVGKKNFLAITFIGKLSDALADDLAGLARTTTMHGFARDFVLENRPDGWEYLPKIRDIIKEDLKINGIEKVEIGDANYQERTNFYKVIGDDDVVHYAVEICKKDESKIPIRDLILIDEFQDFNEIEDEFINLLAQKNEVLIVGDDDQALYRFKGSHPMYIRGKHDESNLEFESHTLRFCSRCPEVIVNVFHDVVKAHSSLIGDRINKDYFYYSPDKDLDSKLNPSILLMESPPGMVAYKVRDQLRRMLASQQIKTVLVIGEARSCKSTLAMVARGLKEYGFRNVTSPTSDDGPFAFRQSVIDGYKVLSKGKNPVLGWRVLAGILADDEREALIRDNYSDGDKFAASIPDTFKRTHEAGAATLNKILNSSKSARASLADKTVDQLAEQIVKGQLPSREIMMDQIIKENKFLERPLANLEITVTNILGSKGLGADVVFLIGFDQGKLPSKKEVKEDEVYQMLVALTRTKKRLYLVSTQNANPSSFKDCIEAKYLTNMS